MKKIISSILINVLLLQAGCYSENWIAKENLENLEHNEIRVITKDKREYRGNKNYWVVKKDTLFLYSLIFSTNDKKVNKQKISIDDIDRIYADQYNGGKTAILLVILGIALIYLFFNAMHNIKIFSQSKGMN